MNTSRAAIDLRGLGKRFGAVQAVDAVTFSVEPGEIFGLMGHNGAGKTTTLADAPWTHTSDGQQRDCSRLRRRP